MLTNPVINRDETRAHASDSSIIGNWEASNIKINTKVRIAIVTIGRRLLERS